MKENGETRRKFDYTWVVIGLSFLMVFITLGFCSSNKGLYLDKITEALKVERSLFSISDSIRFITTAVVSLFFGSMINKFGIKKMIVAGFITLIASMLMQAYGDSLIWFYIGSFLLGVGLSWTSTSMVGCVVNRWCKEKRGTIMGAVLAANGLGGAVAAQIVGPIIDSSLWGYRLAYQIVSVILLVTVVLILIFFRENPKVQEKTEVVVEKKKSRGQSWVGIDFSEARRKTYLYLAVFCVFVTGTVLHGIGSVAITHLKDVGLPTNFVTLVASVTSLSLAIFKFLTGALYDRYGLRTVILICDISAVLVMFAIAGVTNSALGMVLAMFYGLFSSLSLPLETVMIPIIASDFFGENSFNKVMGIFVATNYTGYALGSPLANWVFDIKGTYESLFVVCAIIMLAVTIIFQIALAMAHKRREKVVASEAAIEN